MQSFHYDVYLNILEFLYSAVLTQSLTILRPMIKQYNLLLLLLNGISRENTLEENELCGEMLRICLSFREIREMLQESEKNLHWFLGNLDGLYKTMLVDMDNSIVLVSLCQCIDYLTFDESIKITIESHFMDLLQ